jgi:hypothetical protein
MIWRLDKIYFPEKNGKQKSILAVKLNICSDEIRIKLNIQE